MKNEEGQPSARTEENDTYSLQEQQKINAAIARPQTTHCQRGRS